MSDARPHPAGTWRFGRIAGVDLLARPSLLLMGVVLVFLFAPLHETIHRTATGAVKVTDLMPLGDGRADLIRVAEGLEGEVEMEHEWIVRPNYGRTRPWVAHSSGHVRDHDVITAIAGNDMLVLRGSRLPHADDGHHYDRWTVRAGEHYNFSTTWFASHKPIPPPLDIGDRIRATYETSMKWASQCTYDGPYRDEVVRSLGTKRLLWVDIDDRDDQRSIDDAVRVLGLEGIGWDGDLDAMVAATRSPDIARQLAVGEHGAKAGGDGLDGHLAHHLDLAAAGLVRLAIGDLDVIRTGHRCRTGRRHHRSRRGRRSAGSGCPARRGFRARSGTARRSRIDRRWVGSRPIARAAGHRCRPAKA